MDVSLISCPKCGSNRLKVHGVTASGSTRYKCLECSKTFTGTKLGRPSQGVRAMTNAERQKKYRAKKKSSNLT